jgi:hypothetical protein
LLDVAQIDHQLREFERDAFSGGFRSYRSSASTANP